MYNIVPSIGVGKPSALHNTFSPKSRQQKPGAENGFIDRRYRLIQLASNSVILLTRLKPPQSEPIEPRVSSLQVG